MARDNMQSDGPAAIPFEYMEPDPEPVQEFHPDYIRQPIIIDNGSYECRAGFAAHEDPTLIFRNRVARTKARGNEPATILVGKEVRDADWTRYNLRQIFDGGVVTNFHAQEEVLDHIFDHLSVGGSSVDHPVVMTEPVCNPNYCRQRMSELLFECYGSPSVVYGIDSLFSFHHSNITQGLQGDHGLVISAAHHATYILPVVGGLLDAPNCKRLDIGAQRLKDYLAQLLALKHPHLRELLYPLRIEVMFRDSCYSAPDSYQDELGRWATSDYAKSEERIYQLPYIKPGQLTDEERQKKREEQGQRLKEFMQRKRERELQELQRQLADLQAIADLPTDNKIRAKCKERGYKTIQDLYNAISELEDNTRRKQNKLLGIEEPEVEVQKKEPVYDLLDKDDKDLTEEQKKEKRKQRFLKNASEGRERARLERLRLQQEKEEMERLEEERRKADPEKWLQELKDKKQELLKQRQLRQRRKAELLNRRSAASKQRMRIIMQQANEEQKGSKRAKKGPSKEDTFGIDDSHWDVYREISKEEVEEEEREQEQLAEIEQQLATHDPNYTGDDSAANAEENHQLHLAVERVRVPELVFQPGMVGATQAGLIETLAWVLGYYPPHIQALLVNNIHVTGGLAHIPHLADRLRAEVLAMRPFGSTFHVTSPTNPSTAAWKGARALVQEWRQDPAQSAYISREEYADMGGDYLKEHRCSNRYYPTPQ